MFGLEDITHWQFAKGILLCLTGYYLVIMLYLALKKGNQPQETSFEAEAHQAHHVVSPKAIKAMVGFCFQNNHDTKFQPLNE